MDAELIERLRLLPQRKDETWQGGRARVPQWTVPLEGPPFLPYTVAWASKDGGELDPDLLAPLETIPVEEVLKSLVEFAETRRPKPYRPARIQTNDVAFAN